LAKTDNKKYVDRGRGLVMRRDPSWEDDLGRANRRKNGAPFLYADAMMMQAAALRTACRVAYRRPGGMIRGMLGGGAAPDYTTIYRRIQRLDVDTGGGYVTVRGGGMTLIADATGLKQHNRGERVRRKRRVRRGFARVHLLVDADTRKIVSAVVTDESAGDGPQLKELLERAQERSGRPDAARGDAVVNALDTCSGSPCLSPPCVS